MHQIRIDGQGAKVVIEVDGYENSSPKTDSDANWIVSRIVVESHGFHGSANGALTTIDFLEFKSSLQNCISSRGGKAIFSTDEEWLYLDMTFMATGTIDVRGSIRSSFGPAQTLKFSFLMDLADVDRLMLSLRDIIDAFPVRLKQG